LIIQDYRKKVDDLKSKRDLLFQQKKSKEEQVATKKDYVENLIKAKYTLSQVQLLTQKKFTGYVEQLVTHVIQQIYERDIKFIVNFEMRRGKFECDLLVAEGNNEPYQPENETGGGLLDIISLALRIVMWSLKLPRSRKLLLLDEPFRNLLGDDDQVARRALVVLNELSKKLEMQMIMNTHFTSIADLADKSWIIKHDGIQCSVEALDNAKSSPIANQKEVLDEEPPANS
jgi:hypothetical protein